MQRMALPHPKSRSLGFLGASMPQRGPSGGDPCWPPEAIPAPAVQLVEEELRELVRSDIHRFGVVTHQRAPDPACPFPPRCSKRTDVRLHSAYRPEEAHPWDHLQPPGGLTPRFDKRSSTSRDPKPVETGPQQPTLEDLWFAAAYKGIKSTQRQRRPPALPLADWSLAAPAAQVAAHVDGAEGAIGEQARQLVYPLSHHRADSAGVLEPLPALHEDDFLRGPGGPPLSEESRKHLLVFGLDYKETLSPRNRREWAPMERERWGRSRLLRYLIKTQQVVFNRDLLNREFREDCDKYLKKNHNLRRRNSRTSADISQSAAPHWPAATTSIQQGGLQKASRNSTSDDPNGRGPHSRVPCWWGPSPVPKSNDGSLRGPVAWEAPSNYYLRAPRVSVVFRLRRGPQLECPPLQQRKPAEARGFGETPERSLLRVPHGAPHGSTQGGRWGGPHETTDGEVGCAVMQERRGSARKGDWRKWVMWAAGGTREEGQGQADKANENEGEGNTEIDEDNEEEEYRRHLPWCYHFQYERDVVPERTEKKTKKQRPHRRPMPQQLEDLKLHKAWETELIRLFEAAEGDMPSLFVGTGKPIRQKHPKDKTVPFALLREYGTFIDQITTCGPLQQEVEKCLLEATGAKPERNIPHMDPPKGPRVNPNYNLDKDKLEAAAKKLHVHIEQPQTFEGIEKRRRPLLDKETKVLGGGRYVV